VDRFLSRTILMNLFMKWRSKVSPRQVMLLQLSLKKWEEKRKVKHRRSQVK
jgi:hypothetical protein